MVPEPAVRPNTTKVLLCAIAAFTLTSLPLHAANEIEVNYRRSLEAYKAEHWETAVRLSALALQQLDEAALHDWFYTGSRRPFMTYFSGPLVYMATSDSDDRSKMNKVELYNPERNELVRVLDYTPWHIVGSTHSPNYTVTYLGRDGYLGYRLSWFEKGKPETERNILLPGFEDISSDRIINDDALEVFFRGPGGWALYIFDIAKGTCKEVHAFEKTDVFENRVALAKMTKSADDWKFCDGNKLYRLRVGSWEKELVATLPFRVTPYDVFDNKYFEKLIAVRNDTLHVLRPTEKNTYEARIIHLPTPLDINHWTKRISIDKSGTWFAESDSDSLRIFRLTGDSARLVRSTTSCLGGTYLLHGDLIKTFWRGDTLIHFGNAGLKIFKGSEPLLSIENEETMIAFLYEPELLLMYRVPGEFSALDIGRLETLWSKKLTVSNVQLFDTFLNKYLLINHVDGSSLLDIRSGEEVLRVNYLAGYAREVSRDTTHVLLASENVLGVYNIPSLGRLRGDLIAVAACSKWAQHDTSAALRNAREALGYGANLSGDLPLRLIDIFDELGLRKESIRLIGNMLIRTDDRVWMKKYRSAGGAFLIEPRMGEFFAALGMEKGVFAFPAFIFPFSVAKGEARKCFWFEKPDYRAQLRMLPMCGLSTTRQSFFMYEYRRNEAGTKLVWSPLDFRESGELVNLGPIMETDVAEVNPTNQQFIEYGYAQYPFDTNKEGRAVTMLALRQGGIGGQSSEGEVRTFFTAGIDLTGRGKHWIDSTLITPVRIGDRFYAHERYAHLMANITRGSQADSLGLREGDLVLRLGEHDINTTMTVNRIKTLYPDRYPLELVVLRGADTLRYTILNGRIGFDSYDCLALVEIDPDTGKHMASKRLPPGYGSHLNAPEAINSAGEIIYSRGDTVLFLDPVSGREKRVTINGIADHYRYWGVEAKDIVVLLDPVPVELLALDISKNADDDARVLWKQSFGDVYRLYNEPRYCIGDDSYHIPMILRDGTLLLIDAVNGTVVSRETLPFQDFGFLPQLRNGTLYGIAATKIFGWKVAYYHPPFPWKQAGYGAIAIVPVVFLLILVHRDRVKKLKERQAEELKRAEIDAEISAARKLQAGLIPTGSHRVGDFHIVGTFIPAWEVAGDYFDFQLLDDGRLVVVMGDVSGHGLPAGILVSMAKASIMTLNRKKTIDLQDTLQSLNEVVRNGSPGKDMFMTLCYLIIDPRKRTISCSANGHPFPLIARKDGTVSEIGANGGYPLGIRARQEFEITQVNFRPGDTVLLYTDGIPEKLNEKGEPWGYERFSETFREFAPNARLEEVVEGILGRAIVYTGAVEPEDDMALVAIRYSAESSAR